MSEAPFHAEHYPDGLAESAQIDQVIAHYRVGLTEAVRRTREHFARCDLPGCPGKGAFDIIELIYEQGPEHLKAALVLAIHYLAKNEDLLALNELEEMLRGDGPDEVLRGDGGTL